MKKIFLTMVVWCMFTMAVGAAPLMPQSPDMEITKGKVVSVDGKRVLIEGEGNYQEIDLHILDNTYIVKGGDGSMAGIADLKKNMNVIAYYGTAVTRSLPPQGRAVTIVIEDSKDNAQYMRVAKLEKLISGDIRVLNSNGDRLVRISKAKPGVEKIYEGSDILVWYKFMTMSIPGQATATKMVILGNPPEIKVNLTAGVASARGKEFQVVKKGDAVYLPLRAICEQLGYKVEWNDVSKAVLVSDGANSASLAVGSRDYGKMKMRVQLGLTPEVIEGETVVPMEFFSEVLGLQVEVLSTHV